LTGNPYVGPRPIGGVAHPHEKIYGREREIDELTNMVIAERIVLMYSPSGAGKSSVLQAGLIPELERSRFTVRPIIRVGIEPPAEVNFDPANGNRYVLSSLISMEEGVPEELKRSNTQLARMNFVDYLGAEANGEVLIFDQFEEILTASPMDYYERQEFFTLLAEALRTRGRWAVFSMREDYLAACDPYVNLLPTRMSNTFRLDLLGERAAMQAIQGPAAGRGVEFSEEAARELVGNLRQLNVHQEDGSVVKKPGMHVEPVQLQVVCHRLWELLPEGTKRIERSHLQSVGNVDAALAGYYSATVSGAAQQSGVAERDLRDWFEKSLITKRNTRGQVVQGGEETLRVTPALKGLLSAYLVRSDRRLGSIWYELAHDRLIAPVQASNREWRAKHLNALQCRVEEWEAAGRPKEKLMEGAELAAAKQWAAGNALREEEKEFLAGSEEAQQLQQHAGQAQLERKRNRRLRWTVALILSVGTFLIFGFILLQAEADEIIAQAKQERENMRHEVLEETPIEAVLMGEAAGGELLPLEKGWKVVLRGDEGRAFAVSRNLGTWFGRTGENQYDIPGDTPQGRLLAVGHDGFLKFTNSAGGNLFLKTAVKWLRNEHPGPVLVVRGEGVTDAQDLAKRLREWEFPAEEGTPVNRIPAGKLKDASLLILTHGVALGNGDVEAVGDFVNSGGGVLATGYGWVYAMYVRNGGKEISGEAAEKLLDEYPLNVVMRQFGVRWTNEVARWPVK
jgi:hypothetical protein